MPDRDELTATLQELAKDVPTLRRDIEAEREDRHRQTARIVTWVAVAVATVVLIGAATLGAGFWMIDRNRHRIERAERAADMRWCRLLAVLTSPDSPPTTERGRQIAAELARLQRQFACRE